jgi:hypothetical protein
MYWQEGVFVMRHFIVSSIALVVVTLAFWPTNVWAVEIIGLDDRQDDDQRIRNAANQEPVKKFAEELKRFRQDLLEKDKGDLRQIFRGPSPRDVTNWAMPVAQPRMIVLPGLRNLGAKTVTEVYAVKDFAALKVWYITDRERPVALVVYFAADRTFPKLTGDNLDQRLRWDRDHFDRLQKLIKELEAMH